MKDSPSDGSLVQHLQPPRPSLENTLSNEPTQLMSAMSTAPGRHPQDVESNGDTHQLQLFEEAEAELIIQPEPMDPSSFTTKDTPPLVDAQPLRRRRGLVWGLVALAVAVVAIVIDVRVAVAKPTPISPAPTMSPTVNVIDSTPLMALIPELRASFSNTTNVAIPTTIGRLTALVEILLQENRLSGTLPTELGRLTSVQSLRLSQNNLTGPIPKLFGRLSALQILELGENHCSESIPTEIWSFVAPDRTLFCIRIC